MTTPITEAAVVSGLRAVLISLTGLDAGNVIRARTTLPTRADPYIAIRRILNAGEGRTFEVSTGVYHQARSLQLQIDAVGDDAIDALMTAHQMLAATSPATEALSTAGVGVGAVGMMRDRTRLAPTGHEPYAGFDLALSYVSAVSSTENPSADLVQATLSAVGDHEVGPAAVVDESPD